MLAQSMSGRFIQYVASLAAASSVIVCGLSYGWTSPYLPKLMSNTSTIPTSSDEGSWCAVLPLLGAPVGALIGALTIDRIGRKNVILISGPFLAVLYLSLAYAPSIWIITSIRIFVGVVDGALWTVLPTYIAEICEPQRRGLLTSSIAISGSLGTLFINIIGPYTSIYTSSLICAVIPVIQFMIFLMMPETPYYHLKKSRTKEAKKTLQILRGTEDVQKEFDELYDAIKRQEGTEVAKFTDLFTVPSNRMACLIFAITCTATKFSGKSPILFFTSQIFHDSGSSVDPTLSVIIYNSVELIMTIVTICFIDKFGKRTLILTSTGGCVIAVLVLALHLMLREYPQYYTDSLGWLPIVCLVSYNILFSIGLSFAFVTILGEMFPTSVKGAALGAAETFASCSTAFAGKFFQLTKDAYGMHVPFFTFAAVSAVMFGLMFKMLPETKGKTLEEIQLFLIAQTNSSDAKKKVEA